MRAGLLSVGLLLALTACAPADGVPGRSSFESKLTAADMNVVCLDGVEYWQRAGGGYYRGYLAVKIDPRTLQPSTCKSKYGESCVKTGNVLTCPLPE